MSDRKDDITFKDCEYSEKYDKMGVTPLELFSRQQQVCYLAAAFDKVDGVERYGELYCTDGKEYAATSDMLNPTYECAQCITKFMRQVFEGVEMTKQLDKIIVGVLTKIGESRALQQGDTELYMSRETFDFLESHIEGTALFSDETKPLKVTASGDILMFGSKVTFLSEVEKGTLMIEPGGLTFQV